MSCRDHLLEQWRVALTFRCTEESASIDDLPDPRRWPTALPTNAGVSELGCVMGFALLKLLRSSTPRPGDRIEIALSSWPLSDWHERLCLAQVPAWHSRTADWVDSVFVTVTQLALETPHLLPELHRRVDALNNDVLHAWAMLAVEGKTPPNLFEGLWGCVEIPAAEPARTFADAMPRTAPCATETAVGLAERIAPATKGGEK